MMGSLGNGQEASGRPGCVGGTPGRPDRSVSRRRAPGAQPEERSAGPADRDQGGARRRSHMPLGLLQQGDLLRRQRLAQGGDRRFEALRGVGAVDHRVGQALGAAEGIRLPVALGGRPRRRHQGQEGAGVAAPGIELVGADADQGLQPGQVAGQLHPEVGAEFRSMAPARARPVRAEAVRSLRRGVRRVGMDRIDIDGVGQGGAARAHHRAEGETDDTGRRNTDDGDSGLHRNASLLLLWTRRS